MQPPILGYRKDRLGGRLVTLINCMMLAEQFGTDARFWWWTGTSAEEPQALDPAEIFAPEFIDRWMILSDAAPAIAGRANLVETRARMGAERFAHALGRGRMFLLDDGFQINRFLGQDPGAAQADFSRAAAAVAYAAPVARALEQAEATLRAGDGAVHALHVRRGDVIDADPWRATSWTAKYLPEDFVTAYIDATDAPVLLFSDTPQVLGRLTGRRAAVYALPDLVDLSALAPTQRDLVELLLMARCDTIAAPTLSAFSNGAAILHGARRVTLPRDLDPARKRRAEEALLQRVITAPDSFLNDGDLAQSTAYAYNHATATGQHAMLRATLKQRAGRMLDRFPQHFPMMMSLALADRDYEDVRALGHAARSSPRMWERDLKPVTLMALCADHALAGDAGTARTAAWRFVIQHFARWQSDPRTDAITNYFLSRDAGLRAWFMLPAPVIAAMRDGTCMGQPLVPPPPLSAADPDFAAALPFWVVALDWTDLFEPRRIGPALRSSPGFFGKESRIPKPVRDAEAAHTTRRTPLPDDPDLVAMMGLHAQVLRLHGKYRRAACVLEAIAAASPQDPLAHKRLSDLYFDMDEEAMALAALRDALALAPGHSGLLTAMGRRVYEMGDAATACRLFAHAADSDMPLRLTYLLWQEALRELGDDATRHAVCDTAAALFPEEPRFARIAARLARRRA